MKRGLYDKSNIKDQEFHLRMSADDMEMLQELCRHYKLEKSSVIRYALTSLYTEMVRSEKIKKSLKNDGWF